MKQGLTLKNHHKEAKLFIQRMAVFCVLMIALFISLVARLVYLQIIEHKHFTTLSDLNQLQLIPIPPNRGLIYDRNGVLLAENIAVFNLELIPDRIKNLDETIAALSQLITITPEDKSTFKKQARQTRPSEYVPLHLNLNEEERARFAVNQFRFPGVSVNARLIRHYPFKEAFSHALGYVGRINEKELNMVDPINYSASNFIGKLGIEKSYESILHGTVGYQRVEINASGKTVRVTNRTPPIPGNNIYLTLDSQLSLVVEQALGTHKAAVVIIKPDSGEILSLISTPSYDPNLFVQGISSKDYALLRNSDARPLYNRTIRGQYPFASTIKPFYALAAQEYQVVNPDHRIQDPGYYKLPSSSHIYHDWKKGGHGMVDLGRAVVVSCDTYFFQLANLMGIKRMSDFLNRFGFGQLTGIDVDEELPGLIPTPEWKRRTKGQAWYPGDTLPAGIGQGFLLVTPLQLAYGVSTISQHGVRHAPHLLHYQENMDGSKIPYKEPQIAPVHLQNPAYWDYVINAMHRVMTEAGGTGSHFGRGTSYSLAAKTGTGQNYSAKFHTNLDEKNLPEKLRDNTLFIAFAPVEKPEVAIAVLVENSKIASDIARAAFDYYFLKKLPGPMPDQVTPTPNPQIIPAQNNIPVH